MLATLVAKGFLSDGPRAWDGSEAGASNPDDLSYIGALFSSQVPEAQGLSVYRIENSGLTSMFKAARGCMATPYQQQLWHGTSASSLQNIVLNGFNRAYAGRHGTRLGHGTYFSRSPAYSARFCDRKRARRIMIFADVLVGAWTKGAADLVEPPYRDAERLIRYDSTVDCAESPGTFCVFRDYQALPLYVVEFGVADGSQA